MGFFDTLLTAIAPERAVKRVAAQTAIRAINSGYSNYGASLHKKSMRGWMWHGGSPKEDIEDASISDERSSTPHDRSGDL